MQNYITLQNCCSVIVKRYVLFIVQNCLYSKQHTHQFQHVFLQEMDMQTTFILQKIKYYTLTLHLFPKSLLQINATFHHFMRFIRTLPTVFIDIWEHVSNRFCDIVLHFLLNKPLAIKEFKKIALKIKKSSWIRYSNTCCFKVIFCAVFISKVGL